MSVLTKQIEDYLEKSSWIREMFETGAKLKQQYGEGNVFDFSLGNPDLPPPSEVKQGLEKVAEKGDRAYAFGYMPNAGYPELKTSLAEFLSEQQGVQVDSSDVMISCGAAGGLNSLFRAVLEPGDEVLSPAPYFVEYGFYTSNYGGIFSPVPSIPPQFELDLEAISEKINPRTRIVLINSPNNPTGYVYKKQELQKLVQIIQEANKQREKPILLVSDEPYRFLTYRGESVPSLLPLYKNSIVVSSFSKSHSLAGERLGYVLLNPALEDKDKLMQGLVFTNRILGFVNAPAIGQQVLDYALNAGVDISEYEKRKEIICDILSSAGYNYIAPQGGFYIFPQAPGGDDVKFVNKLQKELILAVPGSGFGFSGFFRLSFCVPEKVIRSSAEGFANALKKVREAS